MPVPRIIKAQATKGWAPLIQHADKFAAAEFVLNKPFRNKRQSQPGERSAVDGLHFADDYPRRNIHGKFLLMVLKLPVVNATVGHAHADALMLLEVVRRTWRTVAREVVRRTHNQHACIGRQGDGNHILRDGLGETDARVKPF